MTSQDLIKQEKSEDTIIQSDALLEIKLASQDEYQDDQTPSFGNEINGEYIVVINYLQICYFGYRC